MHTELWRSLTRLNLKQSTMNVTSNAGLRDFKDDYTNVGVYANTKFTNVNVYKDLMALHKD